jgi:hypothetical protein
MIDKRWAVYWLDRAAGAPSPAAADCFLWLGAAGRRPQRSNYMAFTPVWPDPAWDRAGYPNVWAWRSFEADDRPRPPTLKPHTLPIVLGAALASLRACPASSAVRPYRQPWPDGAYCLLYPSAAALGDHLVATWAALSEAEMTEVLAWGRVGVT